MEKLKVLIVEDEFLIRELLKKYVMEQDEFFDVVGDASSAAEAMDFLDDASCDIIITDINMPGINGIEMVKMIFEVKKHIKVIVVTGYDNFDYAQKCIKVGVSDYLLKPLNEKDFIESIFKVREDVINTQKQELEYQEIINQINEYTPYLTEAFFNEMINSKLDADFIKEKLSLLKIEINEECFQIAIVVVINENSNEKQKLFDLFAFKKIISENLENSYVFFDMKNRVVILNCLNSKKVSTDYEYLKTIMMTTLECELNMGIGSIVLGLENIKTSYTEADQAINYSNFLNKNGVIFYEELGVIAEKVANNIRIDENDLAELEFYLKGGLLDNAKEWIEKHFMEIEKVDNLRIKGINTLARIHSLDLDLDGILKDKLEKTFYLNTSLEIKQFLIDCISDVISFINNIRSNVVSSQLKNIKEYIEENLSNTSLSLTGCAKNFYMNASYLSRMFKQKQGVSFRDYISQKRIEKALEYLGNTEIKAYEIGAMVGLEDPNYFSTLFKKYTGMTITKYRSKM